MGIETPDWLSEIAAEGDALDDAQQGEGFDDLNLMDDLRSQMDDDEIATPAEEASASSRRQTGLELGMRAWQRFFLSVLLFLDVAIVGLLFLIIFGRIALPVM
jgi:hypothetical protein